MRVFGWVTALGVLLVALVAGVFGYNLGLGANIAASGVTPVVYPAYGFGFGFGGFFGFIFFILIIFLIFGAIRRAAWGRHHGYGPGGWKGGGYSPGGWGGGWRQDAVDNEFQRWHRRAHGEPEEPTSTANPSTTPPTSSSPQGA